MDCHSACTALDPTTPKGRFEQFRALKRIDVGPPLSAAEVKSWTAKLLKLDGEFSRAGLGEGRAARPAPTRTRKPRQPAAPATRRRR